MKESIYNLAVTLNFGANPLNLQNVAIVNAEKSIVVKVDVSKFDDSRKRAFISYVVTNGVDYNLLNGNIVELWVKFENIIHIHTIASAK